MAQHWDQQYKTHGHTGYSDDRLYRYDQPLRMRFVRSAISRIVREMGESKSALDIGCGSGDVMQELRKVNLSVLGVDVSSVAVESTNRRFANDPNVSALILDLESERPFPHKFDLVTSITVLQHIADDSLPSVLAALRDGLTPGGRIIAFEIAPNEATKSTAQLNQVFERSHDIWKKVFDNAGLQLLRTSTYAPLGPTAIHRFERSVDSIVGSLRQTPPDLSSEPADQLAGTRSGFKKRLMSTFYKSARVSILAACWPLDYIFKLSMPDSQAYYRMFELRATSQMRDQEPTQL
jgi:2-polyprenyl-3-methyl-5-hydroxy-6-metoxy-1,4-benzoquinol methylase